MMVEPPRTATRWRTHHAGAAVTAHEREEIRVGTENQVRASAIAHRLGRVTSTVTRELERSRARKG